MLLLIRQNLSKPLRSFTVSLLHLSISQTFPALECSIFLFEPFNLRTLTYSKVWLLLPDCPCFIYFWSAKNEYKLKGYKRGIPTLLHLSDRTGIPSHKGKKCNADNYRKIRSLTLVLGSIEQQKIRKTPNSVKDLQRSFIVSSSTISCNSLLDKDPAIYILAYVHFWKPTGDHARV